jgi:membrane associated rhomboid family serine protease
MSNALHCLIFTCFLFSGYYLYRGMGGSGKACQGNRMFNPKSQIWVLYLIVGGIVLALYASDPSWKATAEVLRNSVVLTWLVSLINILLLGNGLGRLLGIRPRQLQGLLGIAFSPFLHRDLGHLVANTVPFLVLGWLVLLQDGIGSNRDFYAITMTILLVGGLGTWIFGRDAIHLGASGLVFGYIGFLLAGAYIGPTLLTLGFSLLVFWMYGNQLWAMLPSSRENAVSWEGHLFGFVGGIIAGVNPDFLAALSDRLSNLPLY